MNRKRFRKPVAYTPAPRLDQSYKFLFPVGCRVRLEDGPYSGEIGKVVGHDVLGPGFVLIALDATAPMLADRTRAACNEGEAIPLGPSPEPKTGPVLYVTDRIGILSVAPVPEDEQEGGAVG